MKTKKFISAFKKSLYKSGDTLELFNNSYTVLSCSNNLTLLKDCKGNPVAYPTDKLKKMLLNSSKDIKKADTASTGSIAKPAAPSPASTAPKGSVVPKGGAAPHTASAGGSAHLAPGSMHGGMIRVDKVDSKGHRYHYWVHGTKGTKHQDASENAGLHPKQFSEKDLHYMGKIKSIISEHTNEEDRPNLEKKFTEFLVAKSAHRNLVEAYNHMQDSGQGNITINTIRHIGNMQDIYQKKFDSFKKDLIKAKSKKSGV